MMKYQMNLFPLFILIKFNLIEVMQLSSQRLSVVKGKGYDDEVN